MTPINRDAIGGVAFQVTEELARGLGVVVNRRRAGQIHQRQSRLRQTEGKLSVVPAPEILGEPAYRDKASPGKTEVRTVAIGNPDGLLASVKAGIMSPPAIAHLPHIPVRVGRHPHLQPTDAEHATTCALGGEVLYYHRRSSD